MLKPNEFFCNLISYVLSNSMDETMRIWDVRPFAPSNRCMKVFSGIKILLMDKWTI